MRALLLADGSFAWRERLMLTRLEVGLTDEGVEIVRAAPASEHHSVVDPGLSRAVLYRPVGLLNLASSQARGLVEGLGEHVPLHDERPLHVVHAWGEGCWSVALETARLLGATLAAELWSARALAAVSRMERRCSRAGVSLLWLAPDEAIRDAAQAARCAAPCRIARWGVHTLGGAKPAEAERGSLSVAVVTGGEDSTATIGAIEGIARVAADHAGLMVFLDSASVRETDRVWKRAEALGLLDRLSVIPDMEARRDLVLRCDVMVCPEARGEHRSIVLDGMATGMAVVARRDPLVSALVDGETAIVVPDPDAASWERGVRDALAECGGERALSQRARRWVRENRPVSAHIASVLEAYRWAEGRDSIRFEAPSRATPSE